MSFVLEMPIRSYLKKFIAKSRPVDPFPLSVSKCFFSALILEPIKKWYVPTKTKDFRYLNDTLRISLTAAATKGNKFTIDDSTVWCVDGRLRELFEQSMIDHVNMSYQKKGDVFLAIRQFLAYYDITEDDLQFETAVKIVHRSRRQEVQSQDAPIIQMEPTVTEPPIAEPPTDQQLKMHFG